MFILDLIRSILRTHVRLFQGGELSGSIRTHLFPTLIGPLALDNDAVFSLSVDILTEIVKDHRESHKEIIEIICDEFFAVPLSAENSDGAKAPLLKGHLRPFTSKIKAIQFIKNTVFDNAQVLFFFFHNYDHEAGMSSLVEMFLNLLNVFVTMDWHNAEGSRITNSSMTERSLSLKLASTEALEAFMRTLLSWHQHGSGDSFSPPDQEDLLAYRQNQIRKREQCDCVELFNRHPSTGLETAVETGVLPSESRHDAAQWMRFTRGLKKQSIGAFLGAVANESYLDAYVRTFNFEGLSFVQSFRLFLESFRIPGEAQIIERFMEKFSAHLYTFLGDEFQSSDVLFQVAYSTLMLNTDMYSTNVKAKMSREAFLKNTLGAIDERDRPTEQTLNHIYDEIAAAEVQLQSQVVEHPLPLGSRMILPTAITEPGRFTAALVAHSCSSWTLSLSTILDTFHGWPASTPFGSQSFNYASQKDLIESILSVFSDFIELTCILYLGVERYLTLEQMLQSKLFKSDYAHHPVPAESLLFANAQALSWIYDTCLERGSDLGSSWSVVLKFICEWDLATLVDGNHNLRELDLGRYDAAGILNFTTALLACPQETVKARNFVNHYGERLFQLSSSQLERVIRVSYEDKRPEDVEAIFAILARGAENKLLASLTFALLQRIAREQMPLILVLNNEAMFGFLRAIERFAMRPNFEISRDAIDALVLIGDMLYSKHCTGQEGEPVGDEDFFLKWYHVLSGLSRVSAEQSVAELSRLAVQSLFKLLREQGHCYQEGAWRVVWRSIILPLLEEPRDPVADAEMLVRLMEWAVALVSLHSTMLISEALHDVFDSTSLVGVSFVFILCRYSKATGKHGQEHHRAQSHRGGTWPASAANRG